MSKTVKQVATGVLQELGRLPQGQVAPAARLKKVTDAYSSLYDYLYNKALVNWATSDPVPEWAVYPIEQLLAGRVGGKFGVDVSKYIVLVDSMENILAEQIANPSEHDTTPGVYI